MQVSKDDLKGMLKVLAFFVVLMSILLILCHFFKFPRISGDSMEPTIKNGDMLLTRTFGDIEVNDIVIIYSEDIDEYLCKRVIGKAGDHIEVRNGYLYRNNIRLYEAYIDNQLWIRDDTSFNIIVPDGELFVMGDNRLISLDSREIGTLKEGDIYGVAMKNLTR